MRRREFIRDFSLCGAATAASLLPWRNSMAQSESKPPVIAWLATLPKGKSLPPFMFETTINNFKRGLSDAGYVHGRNIEVIRTEVFPERIASIDETIAKLTPRILLATATLQAVAARKATATIPIFFPALA